MIEYDNQSKNIIVNLELVEFYDAELFIYDLRGSLVWRSGEIIDKIIDIDSISIEKGSYIAALKGHRKFHCNKLCII